MSVCTIEPVGSNSHSRTSNFTHAKGAIQPMKRLIVLLAALLMFGTRPASAQLLGNLLGRIALLSPLINQDFDSFSDLIGENHPSFRGLGNKVRFNN